MKGAGKSVALCFGDKALKLAAAVVVGRGGFAVAAGFGTRRVIVFRYIPVAGGGSVNPGRRKYPGKDSVE